MKILLTGSSGFVGKHLSRSLSKEHELIEISRSNGHDLTKVDLINIESVDTVIHLASESYVPDSMIKPDIFYRDNYLSTLSVLNYCRKNNVQRLIFLSSYVYGQPEYLPVDELHPTNIGNPYGKSKLICESLCQFFGKDFGLKVLVLRPFNLYGHSQNTKFLIPTILRQAIDDDYEKITLNDLKPKRDFLYIEDFVTLVKKLLLTELHSQFSVFNVGSGRSYSVRDVAEEVCHIFESNKEIIDENKNRNYEIDDCYADIKKIKSVIDWSPQYNLNEGLIDIKSKVNV